MTSPLRKSTPKMNRHHSPTNSTRPSPTTTPTRTVPSPTLSRTTGQPGRQQDILSHIQSARNQGDTPTDGTDIWGYLYTKKTGPKKSANRVIVELDEVEGIILRLEGYLSKKGEGIAAGFKKRWFVFDVREDSQKLLYYENREMKRLMGFIDLAKVYEIRRTPGVCEFELLTETRIYILQAEAEPDLMKWTNQLTNYYGVSDLPSDDSDDDGLDEIAKGSINFKAEFPEKILNQIEPHPNDDQLNRFFSLSLSNRDRVLLRDVQTSAKGTCTKPRLLKFDTAAESNDRPFLNLVLELDDEQNNPHKIKRAHFDRMVGYGGILFYVELVEENTDDSDSSSPVRTLISPGIWLFIRLCILDEEGKLVDVPGTKDTKNMFGVHDLNCKKCRLSRECDDPCKSVRKVPGKEQEISLNILLCFLSEGEQNGDLERVLSQTFLHMTVLGIRDAGVMSKGFSVHAAGTIEDESFKQVGSQQQQLKRRKSAGKNEIKRESKLTKEKIEPQEQSCPSSSARIHQPIRSKSTFSQLTPRLERRQTLFDSSPSRKSLSGGKGVQRNQMEFGPDAKPNKEWVVRSMENWQKTRGSLVFAEEHLSFLNPQKFPAIAFSSTTQRPLLVLSVALEREGRGSQEEKQEDQLMHQVFKCCQDSLKIPSQLAKCLVSLQPKKESEEYGDEIDDSVSLSLFDSELAFLQSASSLKFLSHHLHSLNPSVVVVVLNCVSPDHLPEDTLTKTSKLLMIFTRLICQSGSADFLYFVNFDPSLDHNITPPSPSPPPSVPPALPSSTFQSSSPTMVASPQRVSPRSSNHRSPPVPPRQISPSSIPLTSSFPSPPPLKPSSPPPQVQDDSDSPNPWSSLILESTSTFLLLLESILLATRTKPFVLLNFKNQFFLKSPSKTIAKLAHMLTSAPTNNARCLLSEDAYWLTPVFLPISSPFPPRKGFRHLNYFMDDLPPPIVTKSSSSDVLLRQAGRGSPSISAFRESTLYKSRISDWRDARRVDRKGVEVTCGIFNRFLSVGDNKTEVTLTVSPEVIVKNLKVIILGKFQSLTRTQEQTEEIFSCPENFSLSFPGNNHRLRDIDMLGQYTEVFQFLPSCKISLMLVEKQTPEIVAQKEKISYCKILKYAKGVSYGNSHVGISPLTESDIDRLSTLSPPGSPHPLLIHMRQKVPKVCVVMDGLYGVGFQLVNYLCICGAQRIIVVSRFDLTESTSSRFHTIGSFDPNCKIFYFKSKATSIDEFCEELRPLSPLLPSNTGFYVVDEDSWNIPVSRCTIDHFNTLMSSKLLFAMGMHQFSKGLADPPSHFVLVSVLPTETDGTHPTVSIASHSYFKSLTESRIGIGLPSRWVRFAGSYLQDTEQLSGLLFDKLANRPFVIIANQWTMTDWVLTQAPFQTADSESETLPTILSTVSAPHLSSQIQPPSYTGPPARCSTISVSTRSPKSPRRKGSGRDISLMKRASEILNPDSLHRMMTIIKDETQKGTKIDIYKLPLDQFLNLKWESIKLEPSRFSKMIEKIGVELGVHIPGNLAANLIDVGDLTDVVLELKEGAQKNSVANVNSLSHEIIQRLQREIILLFFQAANALTEVNIEPQEYEKISKKKLNMLGFSLEEFMDIKEYISITYQVNIPGGSGLFTFMSLEPFTGLVAKQMTGAMKVQHHRFNPKGDTDDLILPPGSSNPSQISPRSGEITSPSSHRNSKPKFQTSFTLSPGTSKRSELVMGGRSKQKDNKSSPPPQDGKRRGIFRQFKL